MQRFRGDNRLDESSITCANGSWSSPAYPGISAVTRAVGRETSRALDSLRPIARWLRRAPSRVGFVAPRRAVTRLRRLAARGVEAAAAAAGAREGVREPLAGARGPTPPAPSDRVPPMPPGRAQNRADTPPCARAAAPRARRTGAADQTRCRPNAMPTKRDADQTRCRPNAMPTKCDADQTRCDGMPIKHDCERNRCYSSYSSEP